MKRYIHGLLIGLDQFGNTLFGGNPDETISSRVGRAALRGSRLGRILEHLIDNLFEWLGEPPQHCLRNIEWDEWK